MGMRVSWRNEESAFSTLVDFMLALLIVCLCSDRLEHRIGCHIVWTRVAAGKHGFPSARLFRLARRRAFGRYLVRLQAPSADRRRVLEHGVGLHPGRAPLRRAPLPKRHMISLSLLQK